MHNLRADLKANSRLRGVAGIILGYFLVPGFHVLVHFRMAQWVQRYPAGPVLAKLLWLANAKRGVFIALTSKIGGGLRLPHPTSVVVGDGVTISENVTIYQGVTIGRKDSADEERYPTIGRGAEIYAGATIIGGATIGDYAVIGAHALVNGDVPPRSLAVGIPYKVRSI